MLRNVQDLIKVKTVTYKRDKHDELLMAIIARLDMVGANSLPQIKRVVDEHLNITREHITVQKTEHDKILDKLDQTADVDFTNIIDELRNISEQVNAVSTKIDNIPTETVDVALLESMDKFNKENMQPLAYYVKVLCFSKMGMQKDARRNFEYMSDYFPKNRYTLRAMELFVKGEHHHHKHH